MLVLVLVLALRPAWAAVALEQAEVEVEVDQAGPHEELYPCFPLDGGAEYGVESENAGEAEKRCALGKDCTFLEGASPCRKETCHKEEDSIHRYCCSKASSRRLVEVRKA